MTHIPYRGGAPAINDLDSRPRRRLFDNMPSIMAHVKAGRLRALAVTTRERVAVVPDIPTIARVRRARLRRVVLVRLLRAGTKTPHGGHCETQRRHQRRAGPSPGQTRFERLGADPKGSTPGRARRLPEIGNRQMGSGDQGSEDQGGELSGTRVLRDRPTERSRNHISDP